jgi:hypothetical protein
MVASCGVDWDGVEWNGVEWDGVKWCDGEEWLMAWGGKSPVKVWRNCAVCGRAFKAQKGAKTCSGRCRSRAWRKRGK